MTDATKEDVLGCRKGILRLSDHNANKSAAVNNDSSAFVDTYYGA